MKSLMSGCPTLRITILAARRVLPPLLICPALMSRLFMKLSGPLGLPPPERNSLSKGLRLTPSLTFDVTGHRSLAMSPSVVPVSCDIGEGFGIWELGADEEIMPHIDVANAACGFHAGDPLVMRNTVARAKAHGVSVGAHPSYPDLQGFGRREMKMDGDELTAAIIYQVGALRAFLDVEGMALSHIKPHGALYGLAARDEATANAIADAVELFGVPVLGMAGTVDR